MLMVFVQIKFMIKCSKSSLVLTNTTETIDNRSIPFCNDGRIGIDVSWFLRNFNITVFKILWVFLYSNFI